MQKHNRLFSLIISLSLLAVTVAVIFGMKNCHTYKENLAQNQTENVIRQFNGNAVLPLALAVSEDNIKDAPEYEKEGGFGYYLLKKDGISYTLGGFPDVLDSYCITGIDITSAEYSVYKTSVQTLYSKEL